MPVFKPAYSSDLHHVCKPIGTFLTVLPYWRYARTQVAFNAFCFLACWVCMQRATARHVCHRPRHRVCVWEATHGSSDPTLGAAAAEEQCSEGTLDSMASQGAAAARGWHARRAAGLTGRRGCKSRGTGAASCEKRGLASGEEGRPGVPPCAGGSP
eukprot:1158157-Pelagomonas_calceolata.AAC.6